MIFHMKTRRTTLMLTPRRMKELKRLALDQGRTLSALVDEILQEGIARRSVKKGKPKPFHLPSFNMGRFKVDISDRRRLYEILDEDRRMDRIAAPKRATA
jgi:hypothetical protein